MSKKRGESLRTGCAVESSLGVIGGRWKGVVLYWPLKTVFAQVPPRVEYELTAFGRTLEPLLLGLRNWGERYKHRLM